MTHVGLLGGTFDPPHLGHLVAAEAVRDVLGLDEVRFLVAGQPWMKDGPTHAEHRVAMVAAAVADDPHFTVDDREARRDGPTYTIDTLEHLRADEPGTTWTFVLGTDAAATLPAWHRADEVIALADWAVVSRPGSDWPAHDLAAHLTRVDIPLVDISSTDLRARVRAGRSIRYLVPDPVASYVAVHRLYRPH